MPRASRLCLQVGRVNGNLNLSRSIGDLKYKANSNLAPADQMITAEPDVRSIAVTDEDLFVVLACDGVWDCMTSQEVRIDGRTFGDVFFFFFRFFCRIANV